MAVSFIGIILGGERGDPLVRTEDIGGPLKFEPQTARRRNR